MRVAVFGSYDWNSYPDFMRSITVFIQNAHELGHDNVIFVHTGKNGAENMVTEYVGKTQKFLKQKNFRIKEEFVKDKTGTDIVKIAESGVDYGIIFSTGDKRAKSCMQILSAYNIPYNTIESA